MGGEQCLHQAYKSIFGLVWPWPLTSWPLQLIIINCPVTAFANLQQNLFICFQNIMYISFVQTKRMDKQMNAHCLHLPVWPDAEVICLNIVSTASPLVIILALKGKRKGLDTCYSATHMSQTRDQQCFTISEVAADWHEPMVPQRIMWQSIACANGRLDPPCS